MKPSEAFIARIRAERAARGQAPSIESPAVYALIAAVADANANAKKRETARTD